jgi:hypothetical protein
VDREGLEFRGDAGLRRGGEPDVGSGGAREPGQRLVAGHRGGSEVDDRLEHQREVVRLGQQRTAVRQFAGARAEHASSSGR